jgi:2-polyprenyl-3-methyl-5-hydroxy-6-metoxy-1,4-benzoquinol methylase
LLGSRDESLVEVRNRALSRMVLKFSAAKGIQVSRSLLDVGCGGGELSRYFHAIFKEMVLLDISRKALKVAKCRLPSSLCVCGRPSLAVQGWRLQPSACPLGY